MRSRVVLFLFLLGALLLSGCARGRSMAPVRGRVVCDGKPVGQATLTFSPVPMDEDDYQAGKPATGFTESDGTYVLSTHRARDGAYVGQHRVIVSLDDTNPARCRRLTHLNLEVQPGMNDLEIELKR